MNKVDSTVTIKGREYLVGDDELILPEDPKGNLKIDAEGRLLGGTHALCNPQVLRFTNHFHVQAASTNSSPSPPPPDATPIAFTPSPSTPPAHVGTLTLSHSSGAAPRSSSWVATRKRGRCSSISEE
jgi:hypothetical protein